MTAYVLNSDSVTPIRTATNTAGKPIKIAVPGPPEILRTIAITPDGKTVYVVHMCTIGVTGDTVTPIDTTANTAGKPIKVATCPSAIAITP